ncbi:M23 family metallopeptidase [Nonomuraea roseoviolacea]|uniref:M23ase beta-sheet core domain-containing protein n=1 Tax=Nonomuraea roseoviolacea subsp. carminata TaxID=160689 RepID=A0ABT1JVE1_9ACTN|nr:hypothetical protein [Nonomuraea roseoviolacea subsp. carminata]
MPTPCLPLRTSPPNTSVAVPAPATRTRILLVLIALIPLLPVSPAAADPAVWRWPVEGRPRIVRPFAPPLERWLAGHRGIDLAASPATPVLAAGAGTVRYAGRLAGRGVVSIEHPGGLRTTYLPVTPSVRRGQQVSPGDRLGTLEAFAGHCAESCLHWGLIRPPRYLDPLLLLGQARIRLLPYWDPTPTTDEGEPPRDAFPRPDGPSIPWPTKAADAAPAAPLITTPATTWSPWAPTRRSAIDEPRNMVPPEYAGRTSPPPTTNSHRAAASVLRTTNTSTAYYAQPESHAQGYDGAPATDLQPQGHNRPAGIDPLQAHSETHDHDAGRDRDEAWAREPERSHSEKRGSDPKQTHNEEQGSELKHIHDEEAALGTAPEHDHDEQPGDAATRPGTTTSDTPTPPLRQPELRLTTLTSPPHCASPRATPKTPSTASTVWSLRFPHGRAAAPAAAALGTATILAGLLLVILLRHHKPRRHRTRPRPKSRTVRGAHRKPPRSPRNRTENRQSTNP